MIFYLLYISVVLLRGCWLDGSNKCLKNGAAEVCTCSHDLCNTGARHRTLGPVVSLLSLVTSLLVTRHLATSWQWQWWQHSDIIMNTHYSSLQSEQSILEAGNFVKKNKENMSKAWGVLVKLSIVRILCSRKYSFDDESFSSKWVISFCFPLLSLSLTHRK